MNRDFKLNINEVSKDEPNNHISAESSTYDTAGNIRDLCFIWPNGTEKSRNYAYFIGVDYDPNDGSITVIFTSDTFIIKGSNLKNLFIELRKHISQNIKCTNERYNILDESDCTINEIIVISK